MEPSKRIGVTAVVVLVLAALGAGIHYRISSGDGEADGIPEEALRPIVSAAEAFSSEIATPVTVAPAIRDTLVISVRAKGEASSFQSVVVRAQVSGPVAGVVVRENDLVSEGDVVVEIDPTELRFRLEQAEIQLRQAEERYRELTILEDRITDPEVRAERDRSFRVNSGMENAELQVRMARRDMENARVKAPFAGRVADVRVVPGQWVNAGEELLTVVRTDPIRFDAYVQEGQLQHIAVGREARIEFSAYPGERFVGRIETINPQVDPATRSARVTVSVPNPDGRLLPGMYGDVHLDAQRYPDRLLVPRSAVIERDRSPVIFVYEGDERSGVAMWRYVRTGLQNEDYIEILYFPGEERSDPLEEGELVLTGGHNTLQHQTPVRIVESLIGEGARPQ